MRTVIKLVATALITLCASSAFAQSPPWSPQSSQQQSWQGVYLGVNAGGVWGHDDVTESTSGGNTGFNPDFDTRGGAEGFQGGYNYQAGAYVIGLDADFDFSGADGGYRVISNLNGQDQKFEWLSSIRARIGWPVDSWMPYVTGGIAFSDIKDTFINATSGASEDKSSTRTGWTAGAGLEYRMAENFSARLDYRYYDFGSYTDNSSVAFPGLRYKQEPTVSEATVGISYNFR